jgi:hypothetical protein
MKTRADVEKREGLGELIRFGSFDEWIESLPAEPLGSAGKYVSEWTGNVDYAGALNLAMNGWDEIRPRVDSMMDSIRERISDRTASVYDMTYDVAGAFVDVGAFLSGEPECMIDPRPRPERQGGKVIRIHYNTGALAVVGGQTMMDRGVAVLALIDALTMLGASVEVNVETSSRQRGKTITVLGKVKEAHEPLDVNRLTFILGHPAMHRRINWQTRAAFRLSGCQNGGDTPSCPITMADEVGADVIVGADHSNNDPIVANPQKWILETLRGLGFDVTD